MKATNVVEEKEGHGRFFPPLHVQRRHKAGELLLMAVGAVLQHRQQMQSQQHLLKENPAGGGQQMLQSELWDLGCGEGSLLTDLKDELFNNNKNNKSDRFADQEQMLPVRRLVGVDWDRASLEEATQRTAPRAADFLRAPPPPGAPPVALYRACLLCSSPPEDEGQKQDRHHHASGSGGDGGSEAEKREVAVVVGAVAAELIEHVDEHRVLPALERALFGLWRPHVIVVTTPNADFNALLASPQSIPCSHLSHHHHQEQMNSSSNGGVGVAGFMRHPDHKFEWTRIQFASWAARMCHTYLSPAQLSSYLIL